MALLLGYAEPEGALYIVEGVVLTVKLGPPGDVSQHVLHDAVFLLRGNGRINSQSL
jgi:hypothetical protein